MNITNEQKNAAAEVVELIVNKLGTNGQIHFATAIATAARLSGSLMLRSFNFDLKEYQPGTVLLSEEANEKGPMLINVLAAVLSNFGFELDKEAVDQSPQVESKIPFADSLTLSQDTAIQIMERHHLNYEQMAFSGAIATALLIKQCRPTLSIESGFNTAILGFIEGSKTCPPTFGTAATEAPVKKKGFFRFWN